MLILVQKENEQGQARIFSDTYFEGSQKHQTMYSFEHINNDNPLNFFF